MTNIFKKATLLLASILMLAGCNTNNNTGDDSEPKEVKVEEIYFELQNNDIYVDHFAQIKKFEVYPADATNKNVEWVLEDPTLGEVVKDKLYAKNPGTTNLICKALDGSNVTFSQRVEFLPLIAPSLIEGEDSAIRTIGVEYVPNVRFEPYFTNTDQRYKITIPDEYKDICELSGTKAVVGKKAGTARIKVSAYQNENIFKFIDVTFENDLLASSKVSKGHDHSGNIYDQYESRTSVYTAHFPFVEDAAWPSTKFDLPRPINLSKEKLTVDVKSISGSDWFCFKFLDKNGMSILRLENGRDFEIGVTLSERGIVPGSWGTIEIPSNPLLTKDVYTIQVHLYSTKYIYSNGELTKEFTGDEVVMAFDNLVLTEIPVTEIVLLENEIDIDMVNPYEIKVDYLPNDATAKIFNLKVKEGSEDYVEIIDNNKVLGKKEGTAYITVYSPFYEGLEKEIKVNIYKEIPHANAIKVFKGKKIQYTLPEAFNVTSVVNKAISFEFNLKNDGQIKFAFNNAVPGIWYNYSNDIYLIKNSNSITSNVGVITPTSIDGWYKITINESELTGDGRASATELNVAYGGSSHQTCDALIDFTTLKIEDLTARKMDAVVSYTTSNNNISSAFTRYSYDKITAGAIAFDIKLENNSSLTFNIQDKIANKAVVSDLTVSLNGGVASSSRGKLVEIGQGWYTIIINANEYNGAITGVVRIDQMTFSVNGNVSIDWGTVRLLLTQN